MRPLLAVQGAASLVADLGTVQAAGSTQHGGQPGPGRSCRKASLRWRAPAGLPALAAPPLGCTWPQCTRCLPPASSRPGPAARRRRRSPAGARQPTQGTPMKWSTLATGPCRPSQVRLQADQLLRPDRVGCGVLPTFQASLPTAPAASPSARAPTHPTRIELPRGRRICLAVTHDASAARVVRYAAKARPAAVWTCVSPRVFLLLC